MVDFPLPFRCLDNVGWVHRILREDDGGRIELSHRKCGERAIILEAVRDVFQESLDVEVEGGRRLGSPRVVEDDVFWFFQGEGAAIKLRFISFDF